MEEQTTNSIKPVENKPKAEKSKSKLNLKKALMVILAALLIVGPAIGVYFWQQNEASKQASQYQSQIDELNKKNEELQTSLDAEKAKSGSVQKSVVVSPSAEVSENVEAAVSSKNYAALEDYMDDRVMVILAASEGIGERTPAQVVGDLAYLSSGTTPWNFDLPAAELASYREGDYARYIPDSGVIVGKSANGYVVVFAFNSSNKITDIFMSPSSELL